MVNGPINEWILRYHARFIDVREPNRPNKSSRRAGYRTGEGSIYFLDAVFYWRHPEKEPIHFEKDKQIPAPRVPVIGRL